MKLKHPMGKQFAAFEVAEQDTIADILKGRMMPGVKPMGDVKAPTDAELRRTSTRRARALSTR